MGLGRGRGRNNLGVGRHTRLRIYLRPVHTVPEALSVVSSQVDNGHWGRIGPGSCRRQFICYRFSWRAVYYWSIFAIIVNSFLIFQRRDNSEGHIRESRRGENQGPQCA